MTRPTALAHAPLAALLLLVPSGAGAQPQGDEWSTFGTPSQPTAAPQPTAPPATPAQAGPAVPAAPRAATTAPKDRPNLESGLASTRPAPRSTPDPAQTTGVKESFLPGGEPHSPGTAGNTLTSEANLRVMSGTGGATGLASVGSADLGRPGVLRLSLTGEYFRSSEFPILRARNVRSAGTLGIGYTALKHLELFLSYAASANTNSRASPQLMQAQGDVRFGAKGAMDLGKGFSGGVEGRLIMFPGVGDQDVRHYAFGFAPQLLCTHDVRRAYPKVPLRVHGNLGFVFDGTGNLARGQQLTAPEEFALGVNQYDRFTLAFGLESPLPWATPFVEWGFASPLSATNLVGPDLVPVTVGETMPQKLTFGAKVTALKDVAFLAALELGFARRVARGIPATMPWNLVFGVSYNVDPLSRGASRLVERTTVVEKRVEVAVDKPPHTGKVSGAALDALTGQPVPGVVVAMLDTGLPPVASDADGGRFLTHELPAGPIRLSGAKDGYKLADLDAFVEEGKVASVQMFLQRDVKLAGVKVSLVSGKQKVQGKVVFSGPKPLEATTGADGVIRVELPAGHYATSAEAVGCLARMREIDVPEAGELLLDFDLAPAPKAPLVVITQDRIQIKQQVHFATGKATILPDSTQLLDQVVDAIVRSGAKMLRIEGHTDNQGGKEANLKLSRDRARAVLEFLVKRGADRGRLSAEGLGDTRPIAPNLTAKGRELNRRVEFVIVER